MKWPTVIVVLIVCSIPSIVEGFFLRDPEHEEGRHNRFDIFMQELIKFKIRMIKNIIYPILVEIPWKKIFDPEKYYHEQAILKKVNLSDAQTQITFENSSSTDNPRDQEEDTESSFGSHYPTEEMIRLSVPEDAIDDSEFDEIEMLKVIPQIVEELRLDRVTHEEKVILRSIYGELWPLVEREAKRDPKRPMNPILRAIFNSRELQMTSLAKTRRARSASNDFMWNSLAIINHEPKTNLRQKRHNPSAEPSARLLDTVAILVRESLDGLLKSPKKEQERKKRRLQKKRIYMHPVGELPQPSKRIQPEMRFFFPTQNLKE